MLMKLESDSTPAMTKVAVVSTTSRSLNRSPSISASARWVMRSEVVGRLRAAHRHLGGEEVAELLEGGDVLRVAAFHGLVGGDRENDLAPDVGMVARWQAHGAEEHADRDLAGEIVDELELLSLAYAHERAVCNIESGCNELLDVLARERGLAQRPQPIVAGRVGRSQGCASAAGKLVDHVALRRGEGFPIARRLHDVVVAGEDPELAAVAPVAGILLAQDFVVRKGIGIDFRRIEIECFHHAAREILLSFGFGQGYHGR